ncbi:MAG: MltA domain-containing protein [Nitrosomonas sp.]|nr:MltA domain-containing protein [Nitrosomonas sp.]
MKNQLSFPIFALLLSLAACSTETPPPTTSPEKPTESITQPDEKPSTISTHVPAKWSALTGWLDDDLLPAWETFLQSCTVLAKQPLWQETCSLAASIKQVNNSTLRNFFEAYFVPHQIIDNKGSDEGLITGYYEPLLQGSRTPSERFRFPLYSAPDELLVIDLSDIYPELKDLRLRGRLDGRKVVPYYSRGDIMNNPEKLSGHELVWVDNEVELFFLQIQGSGRIKLGDGEILKVGYADQNGYPYNSIGRILVEQDELPLEKASMQGIKQWGQQNPDKLNNLLQQNARYVFFRELPADLSGPIGALGVPLTAGRSIAIDPRSIPQGAPVFLATTWPNTDKPLNRLMVAQDVGGAIKGGIRADFFWGFGEEAGEQAGKMKQKVKMWVLMPQSYTSSQLARH